MDVYDAFIYNLHQMIGHDATARFLGFDPNEPPKSKCHICHPDLCTDSCKGAHQPSTPRGSLGA